MFTPLLLAHYTATSCLGSGLGATLAALRANRSGLARCQFEDVTLPTCCGAVAGLDRVALPAALARFDCRNHRLALHGLQQDGFLDAVAAARQRYGAQRIGVFLGTSTSGILETEHAYRQRGADGALPAGFDYASTHSLYALAEFVRRLCTLGGPAAVVSTACSSSAKVYASAARLIHAGVIDAAIVGGVDSLCLTTLYGFNSLELLAEAPCRPFDRGRDGISIGEAAAFALLERRTAADAAAVLLCGVGESSDAHHMSSPHPQGLGAQQAMQTALASAGCTPAEVDYINLHGTATPSNDEAEARAVRALFGSALPPASSTKGATGHTLGAAGALEAVICALALREGLVPASTGTRAADPALGLQQPLAPFAAPLRRVLSNSFGFGGTNASLLFARAGDCAS